MDYGRVDFSDFVGWVEAMNEISKQYLPGILCLG